MTSAIAYQGLFTPSKKIYNRTVDDDNLGRFPPEIRKWNSMGIIRLALPDTATHVREAVLWVEFGAGGAGS